MKKEIECKVYTCCFLMMFVGIYLMWFGQVLASDKNLDWQKAELLPAKQITKGYPLKVIKLHDGDTITNCEISVGEGFNIIMAKQKIRFSRIQAPEIGSKAKTDEERKAGEASRKRCQELIDSAKMILFVPEYITRGKNKGDYKKGGRGRWLGEVYLDGKNLSDILVKENFARYKKY